MKEEGDDNKHHKGRDIEWNGEIWWFGNEEGGQEWSSDLHPILVLLEGMATVKFWLVDLDDY